MLSDAINLTYKTYFLKETVVAIYVGRVVYTSIPTLIRPFSCTGTTVKASLCA